MSPEPSYSGVTMFLPGISTAAATAPGGTADFLWSSWVRICWFAAILLGVLTASIAPIEAQTREGAAGLPIAQQVDELADRIGDDLTRNDAFTGRLSDVIASKLSRRDMASGTPAGTPSLPTSPVRFDLAAWAS